MKIKYPTWKVEGTPTPYDTIWICPKCGEAHWGWKPGNVPVCYQCPGRKGGPSRMRVGTAAEHEEAKKHLKEIIGLDPNLRRGARYLVVGVLHGHATGGLQPRSEFRMIGPSIMDRDQAIREARLVSADYSTVQVWEEINRQGQPIITETIYIRWDGVNRCENGSGDESKCQPA